MDDILEFDSLKNEVKLKELYFKEVISIEISIEDSKGVAVYVDRSFCKLIDNRWFLKDILKFDDEIFVIENL